MLIWAAPCARWQTSCSNVCFSHISEVWYRQCLFQYWYIFETSSVNAPYWHRSGSGNFSLSCCQSSSASSPSFLCLCTQFPGPCWFVDPKYLEWHWCEPLGTVAQCVWVFVWIPWLNSGRESGYHYVSSQQMPRLLQYLVALGLARAARSCTN